MEYDISEPAGGYANTARSVELFAALPRSGGYRGSLALAVPEVPRELVLVFGGYTPP